MARLLLTDSRSPTWSRWTCAARSSPIITVPHAAFLCGVAVLADGRVAVVDRAQTGCGSVSCEVDPGPMAHPPGDAILDRPTGASTMLSDGLLVMDAGNRRLLACTPSATSASQLARGDLIAPLAATDTRHDQVWSSTSAGTPPPFSMPRLVGEPGKEFCDLFLANASWLRRPRAYISPIS